jgi:hypothetical protein
VECSHRVGLVVAQAEGRTCQSLLPQDDGQRCAVDISRQVLNRPTDLDEVLFENAPCTGVYLDTSWTQAISQEWLDVFSDETLGNEGFAVCFEDQ